MKGDQSIATANAFETNPFATRWTHPGAMPFIFPNGIDLAVLVQRLKSLNGWGQIRGRHGSGKSTLLATLIPELQRIGKTVELIVLRDRQRDLPEKLDAAKLAGQDVLLIVDGYEQLSWWSKFCLRRKCVRESWGLLVTSHVNVGLPELMYVELDESVAQHIVSRLQANVDTLVTREDVNQRMTRHQGNMRETLFALYDLYELRRRRRASPSSSPNAQL